MSKHVSTCLRISGAVFAVLLVLAVLSCGTSDQGGDAGSGQEMAMRVAEDDHAGHDHEAAGSAQDHEGDDHAGHDHEAAGSAQDCEGDDHAGHDHEAAGSAQDHAGDDHAGHDHGEGSDLDRPVEDLFGQNCEHAMRAHQCGECRYEVGVVKVAPELLEQDLVSTGEVDVRDFGSRLSLTGEIRFDERTLAHLSPRVPGIVKEVRTDLGREVRAGEVLVLVESPDLADAESAYLEARASLDLAEKAYQRQKDLWEEKITSEREYLETRREREEASIRSESARLRLIRLGLGDAEIAALEAAGMAGATGILPIKAPLNGEVVSLHAVRGESVEPGDDVLLLADVRSLWVWVDLYERHIGHLLRAMNQGDLEAEVSVQAFPGLDAEVSVQAFPGELFRGRVDYLDRTMDEGTRTVKARVVLENPGRLLRPGMFASVRLSLDAGSSALAVPGSAILADEGREFVFVHHQDDYFVRRPVHRGREDGGFVEVVDGLQPGQRVVTTGAFLLKSDVLRSKMGEGCAH